MTTEDVASVIALQLAYLEGSTLTELGPRFLSAFHRAALAHPDTHAFVAHSEGELAGFLLASGNVAAFNAAVKPKVLPALAWSLLTAAEGPRLTWTLLKSLTDREPEPYVPAELLLLVVDGRKRRRGVGRRLIQELDDTFRRLDAPLYRVAVRSHLALAQKFYEATGFKREQEIMVLGQPMTYLLKQLAR